MVTFEDVHHLVDDITVGPFEVIPLLFRVLLHLRYHFMYCSYSLVWHPHAFPVDAAEALLFFNSLLLA